MWRYISSIKKTCKEYKNLTEDEKEEGNSYCYYSFENSNGNMMFWNLSKKSGWGII